MELGAFSISLAVKNLEASRKFYEKFGFKPFGGDPAQNWLILKNGDHVIGLFQGMFEKQRQLKAQGVKLVNEADESTTGPASFIAVDSDGNAILVDQHV